MIKYTRLLAFLSVLGIVTFSAAGVARPDGGHPTLPKISDPSPYAGELVLVTVPLSEAATTNDTLTISSTTSGNFDSLVSSVNYYIGDTSVSFYAQIDVDATGDVQITATNENGSAGVLVPLQPGF